MKKYTLGLHIGHDATVALLEGDAGIVSAVSEERFSRIKNHNGFPYQALEYMVNKYGINDSNLLGVALTSQASPPPFVTDILFNPDYSQEPLFWVVPDRLAIKYHLGTLKRIWNSKNYATLCSDYYREKLKKTLERFCLSPKIFHFEHHLCHAASAYYSSGKERVLLITCDGLGDGISATVNIGSSGIIKRVALTPAFHSVGRFYSALTDYLGFNATEHEGKITGLAAFGNADTRYKEISCLLSLSRDKSSFRTGLVTDLFFGKIYSLFYAFKKNKFYNYNFEPFKKRFKKLAEGISSEDLAAAVQKRLEDVMRGHISAMMDKFKIYDVALAGGVFANVKLNQRISEVEKIESLFIHPNMGDGGLSFGAAFLLKDKILKNHHFPERIKNVYLGPGYTDEEIFTAIREKDNILDFEKNPEIEKIIAGMLAEGKIVAFFQNRMEYGPRALGNRSILADARNKEINDILNKRLKRTEFMPFAPSILEERAVDLLLDYEKFSLPAQFMTITFNVNPSWRQKIPAVVHVDGTARPHIVKKEINPRFHKIIREYESLTGIPAVINTSFNMHEMPIVCSPADAINDFLSGAADVLVMENVIVTTKHSNISQPNFTYLDRKKNECR